jgi:cytochrome P450
MGARSSTSLDAREMSLRYSCNSIARTTYAVEANAYGDSSAILHYGRQMWDEISDSSSAFSQPKQVISSEVNQFFVTLTRHAIENRLKTNQQRNDLLSFIISLRDKRDTSEIESAAHAMTFFLDGFETASLALCYALYELSRNGRVQEKLRQEILECCNDEGEDKDRHPLAIDTLLNLPYLDQVFHEAVRLHPPLYYTTRVCTEDAELTSDGGGRQLIRKGTAVWIPIYSIHRDSEHYRNPDEFLPERFDEECGGVKAFRDKCVLIPFGDGGEFLTDFLNLKSF